MAIKNIAVIGGGTMGSGIVTVFAMYGFQVTLAEMKTEFVQRALFGIEKSLDKLIQKEKITPLRKEETLNNIVPVIGLTSIPVETELIVEAVNENRELKLSIFKELNGRINPKAIFASNTSSISITELAQSGRPDKFIGMHFMNPVPVMQLVEIIKGYQTSQETYNTIKEMTIKIEKTPIEVNDYPGFISNRVLMPFINEAVFALMEGVSTVEDIDNVVKLGLNHPMGPLTLADFIGLDVCLNIMEVLYNGFQDSKYRPSPLLKKMVAAGKLGKKSGEGFYKYN
ncbi:MAG: 3-hydroxybutyryl-CoA dehydrogenase [Ignavibacteriaceae bacterium]|jgi:3-hydroxybutyryl-CoA dehydrogenase|nr:3-hydroxybutyryl-CoA dehydrogenase [Ignavibacteriaceae bacterium]HPO55637.1 3-hydroxybutyryl-CoA dehydrogenase [Ignavibacteriaceae bacterium]